MPDLVIDGVDEFWSGRCQVCGCTDDQACPGGCWWVDDGLCSECVAELVDDYGDDTLLAGADYGPVVEVVDAGGLLCGRPARVTGAYAVLDLGGDDHDR